MQVSMLLDMAADGFGDRVLVGRRDGGITAARLRELAAGGAAAIRDRGADALVYLAVNGEAFPVALYAAALVGVPLVPLNYRLGAEQLSRLLAKHPGALGIVDPGAAGSTGPVGIGAVTTTEWLALAAERAGEPEPAESSGPAVLIYTSGSTSEPKGVLLGHHNLVSYVLSGVEFGSAGPADAALMCVPPYHIASVANVLTNTYAGRRFIAVEAFSPDDWLATVRAESVTNALVVPTMLARILERDELDVPSLVGVAYGGAPMPSVVIERALRVWPHVEFVNAYGLTETSSTIALLGPEDHRAALTSSDPVVRGRLGSVGRVVPAVEVQIRDAEGTVLGPGQAGRIWVRGDQVSAEYAGRGSALDDQGFFDTRDEGHLDRDGYLYVNGRADDTIIRGAENVAPAEIEDVLLRLPGVADAVVVGVPDPEWGHRIEAAVVPEPGTTLDPEELRGRLRSVLRGSKTPDRIVCWTELPRTDTGKLIRRHALDRMLAEHSGSRAS